MKINGLKVVDARRPLTITITSKDVQRGATKNPSSCAAALAVKRQTHCVSTRVHLSRTYLMMRDRVIRYLTPQSIRSEIIAFDRGAEFDPGEYTLGAPTPAMRLGVGMGSNTSRTKPKHKQKMRKKYHVVSGVRPRGANR